MTLFFTDTQGIQYTRVSDSPKLSLTFQRSIKVRERGAHLGSLCRAPQQEVCKVVKVKSVLQCEPQDDEGSVKLDIFKEKV